MVGCRISGFWFLVSGFDIKIEILHWHLQVRVATFSVSIEVTDDLIPRTFRSWKQTEIQDTFGLRRVETLKELDDWLSNREPVPQPLIPILADLQHDMKQRADGWNEEEWKLSFIGPVIALVDYNTDKTGFFSGRLLEARVGDYLLSGIPDGIVAEGTLGPRTPYFCLHEYKKEEGDQADPRGQLLAAMLSAQALNEEDSPIYGAYVLGRLWFFAVLKGQEYAFSDDYSSSKDEFHDIFGILLALKTKLMQRCG